jgi:hypothetical protein
MRFANVKALGAVSLIAPMTCLAPTTLRATSPAAPGSITADLKAERAKYDAQIAALERARAAALSTVRSAYVADLDDAGRKAVSTGKNEEAKATISKQTELVEQIRAEVRRANFDRAGPAGPIENNVVLNGDFAETQPNGMPTHWWLNGPGKAAVITEDGAKILRVASTSNSETWLRQPVKVPAGSKELRVQLRVRAPEFKTGGYGIVIAQLDGTSSWKGHEAVCWSTTRQRLWKDLEGKINLAPDTGEVVVRSDIKGAIATVDFADVRAAFE